MLQQFVASQHGRFQQLADAWLAAGATSFGVTQRGQILACWPDSTLPEDSRLIAPIQGETATLGELQVTGISDLAAVVRIHADADLLSELLQLAREMAGLTAEYVNSQDQMLALVDLVRALRSQLTVEQMLSTLAQEARRLVGVETAFALLCQPGGSSTILVQEPAEALDEETLWHLFQQVQPTGVEMMLNQDIVIPHQNNHIRTIFLRPFAIKGQIVAALGLVNKPGGQFDSTDIKLTRAIADQASALIENLLLHQDNLIQARLHAELDVAKTVQLRLLPRTAPKVAGLEITARSRPALEVGGDFYNFSHRQDRAFVFTIGDVSGKGMPAAMLMAMMMNSFRSKATFLTDPVPAMVLDRVNEDMYDDFSEVGMFATSFVGSYDPATRLLHFANAGHAPAIYRCAEGPSRLMEPDGVPIGVLPNVLCEDGLSLPLNPGDLLVLGTDGFNEARDPQGNMFGYERLLSLTDEMAAAGAEQILDRFFAAITSFSAGHPQEDDQTLMVIKGVAT